MKSTTFYYFISLLVTVCMSKREISPTLSIVEGPAFDIDMVLPVRYFTIQAIDSKGKRYTHYLLIESLIIFFSVFEINFQPLRNYFFFN